MTTNEAGQRPDYLSCFSIEAVSQALFDAAATLMVHTCRLEIPDATPNNLSDAMKAMRGALPPAAGEVLSSGGLDHGVIAHVTANAMRLLAGIGIDALRASMEKTGRVNEHVQGNSFSKR